MSTPLALCNTCGMPKITAMPRLCLSLVSCALFVTASCDKKSPPPTASSAAPSAAAVSAKPTAEAAPPTPAALKGAELQKSLKCAAKRTTEPCQVLADFKYCEPFKIPPSGDGRWIGNGYLVKDGAFTEEVTLLRARRVPLKKVAKGQLPIKLGVARLPSEEVAAQRHAKKAIGKLSRHDVVKDNNEAVRYLNKLNTWHESSTVEAEHNQVYGLADGGVYLCALKDQRLLLVKRAKTPKHPADGLYAVLWPVTW